MKGIKDFIEDEHNKSKEADFTQKKDYKNNNDVNDDMVDDETIEITVDLDIADEDDIDDEDLDESELNERKIRQTRKMKNSAKVRETTAELFGKDGTARPLADKVFKIFKRELRKKAKDLGVSLGQVRQWKITLRDHDSPKEGTNISGKPQ